MRWIVITLLLINALIFGWRWFGPEAEPMPAPQAAAAPTDHAIELLADEELAVEGAIGAVPQQALLAEVPPLDTDPQTPETGLAEANAAQAGASDIHMGDEPAVANAASERALTSTPSAVHPETAGPHVVPASTPAAAPGHCAWTAWLSKLPELEPGTERLAEQQREVELGRSYLVYIPGLGSREQTLARLAEVKDLGIEAAFLNKGPQAGGISLGLFSKRESMDVRLSQLKAAKVTDAQGLERIRTEAQHRRLLRWTGEKTPTSVQNQALISCNEIAPAASGQ